MINWFKFHKPERPESVRKYQHSTRARLDRRVPCQDLRLVVLDSETTGFSPAADRLLSIATIEISAGQIDLSAGRQWMVFQPNAGLTSSTVIHGILPSETRQGTPEEQVLLELLPLLNGAVVIGHHAAFDAAMLNAALRRHFKIGFSNRIIDTALMARQELTAFHRSGYANQRPPSLEEVCEHLGLPMIARHTAEGDAFVTAQIFLLLCGRMRRRTGRPVMLKDLPVSRVKQ